MKSVFYISVLLFFFSTHAFSAFENFGSNKAYIEDAANNLTLYRAQTASGTPIKGNAYELDAVASMGTFVAGNATYAFSTKYPEDFDDLNQAILVTYKTFDFELKSMLVVKRNFHAFAQSQIEKPSLSKSLFLKPDFWYFDYQDEKVSDLPSIKGMPSKQGAKWSYKVTDISDDGKIIIGIATASENDYSSNKEIRVKEGTQVAVYWVEEQSHNLSSAKPLAIKLQQSNIANDQIISAVSKGLTRAFDIIPFQESTNEYLISGQAHDGSIALMKLALQ